MSTIVKETETLPVSPEALSPRAAADNVAPRESTPKPQPVALEVSITVNGARSVDGSDKREPFSESSKTVLVFGNGAVIRLQSSVAPGQLLFLTNEKTKKEVVCQVVKSKNYRNVSGYVELEFTEPIVGFWGMRFPGDRIAPPSASAATPAAATPSYSSPATGTPVAPPASAPSPAVAEAPKLVPSRVAVPAMPAQLIEQPISAAPTASALPPARPDTSTTIPPALDLTSLRRSSDSKLRVIPAIPAAPATPAPIAHKLDVVKPPAADATEALRVENARLQEQLSAFLGQGTKKPEHTNAAPSAPEATPLPGIAAKVLEVAAPPASFAPSASIPPPVAQIPVLPPPAITAFVAPPAVDNFPAPGKMSTTSLQSLLDEEPVKIPAWLESLARNAVTPALPESKVVTESLFASPATAQAEVHISFAAPQLQSPVDDFSVPQESAPVADASVTGIFEVPAPTFSSDSIFNDENSSADSGSKSNKGFFFAALAASVLLAAGLAYWYTHQGAPAGAAQSSQQSSQQNVAQTNPSTVTSHAAGASSISSAQVAQPSSAAGMSNARPQGAIKDQAATPAPLNTNLVVAPGRVTQPGVASSGSSAPGRSAQSEDLSAVSPGPVSQPLANQPAPAQSKKASLGDVHLAAPTVRGKSDGSVVADADLALNTSAAPGDASLGASFASTAAPAAPSAPVPVGGDVKTAKLLKSVPPVYPNFAKTQRVSGDVKIDALIDAAGQVTTMKVVSGPAMLHQAAMDALRQWKYQPAKLDGKSVSMHLTVTLQFHLQ